MSPERTRVLTRLAGKARIRAEIPAVPIWLGAHTALVLVLLGVLPNEGPAFYLTAVALGLFLNALMLLYLVYRQGSRMISPPNSPQ